MSTRLWAGSGGAVVPKLEWRLARNMGYRQECWISSDFAIVIGPTDKSLEKYRAGVIRHGQSFALYRSARVFGESAAKAEAIKQGFRIAKREARIHSQIADLLRRALAIVQEPEQCLH